MLITEDYRRQNQLLHEWRADYGSKIRPQRFDQVRALAEDLGCRSILDYGCGKGALARHVENVRNYDPALPEFAADPAPADLVVSIDVLEHIELDCLKAVLAHIRALALKGAFLIVTTRPDGSKTLPDGRDPHLIVRPAEWWIGRVRPLWNNVEGEFNQKEVTLRCRA